ncbi:U5 small nuclear ribonucleoprotein TSSC4 [Maniola hyperantus]|uniref:U5 small nuclear ribonucleoprotein TSSC4 n=1 Tax=Aphantopus hyperantus TaxID=2795564 RepID=UPI0015694B63|nr:protein TSSC4 [Maniola hyperantus]
MSSFQDRQKSLFNHLKDAEEQYSFSKSNKVTEQPDYGVIDKRTYRKIKREMKQFRGRESIYKRQDANLRECLRARSAPDHMRNPQKWQYYSLSDVTPDQMSDKTNTETALAFMREMEERESKDNEVIDETGAVFKKPTFSISKTIKKLPEEQKQPLFKGNKIIMPEYVVGMSKKKVNKLAIRTKKEKDEEDKKAELKLNHLYENDDEDDYSNNCT